MNSKSLIKSLFLGTIIAGALTARGFAAGPLAPAQNAKQLRDALTTATSEISRYRKQDLIDPKFRSGLAAELTAKMKHVLDLSRQLAKADPQQAKAGRGDLCINLALLALWGNADAAHEIDELSKSTSPDDAIVGKVAKLTADWWLKNDAESQKSALNEFESIAKANPTDDLLVQILPHIARYGAANDEVGTTARQIVINDLKGPEAKKYLARPDKIGFPLVVSGNSVQGKMISTAAWKGKVVVLDFWASWCQPCKQMLPEIVEFYQQQHEKGFEIVGISSDYQRSALTQYLAQNKQIAWPQLFQPAGAHDLHVIAKRFNIDAIPTTYVIDRNGILRDVEVSVFPKDLILQLLAEEPKSVPTTLPSQK